MERKYAYIIILLLSITFGVADHFMNRSLESVNHLNEFTENNAVNGLNVDDQQDITLTEFTITNDQSNGNKVSYNYNIKIDDVTGAHRYIKSNNETGYLVFAANGVTNFTLNENETITISDVPTNVAYSITQETNTGYKTYINSIETNVASGIVALDNNVKFDNVPLDGASSGSFTPTIPTTPSEPETPTEPEQPEEPTPEEPETPEDDDRNEPEDNPYTSDVVILPLVVLVITLLVLLIVPKIKVKRFE